MPDRDRDLDLFFEQLVEGRLSRRQVLRRLGAAGLTFSSAGTLLAACGGAEGTKEEGAGEAASADHPQTAIDQLNFSNWPLYIDKKVLRQFERMHDGAKVRYSEEINDNDEFFGKVRQQLQRGDSLNRDIVVLTDWMASRWVRNGWVEPKDKDNIPNEKNLIESLRSPQFDPERSYSLPWQSGMTAIGYNRKETGRDITSLEDLFDPEFKGKVSMLADVYDSAGIVLLMEGKRTEDATVDDILAAIERIEEENRKGQIRRFTGNDYTTDLTRGNLALALAYSGDLIQLQADNPDLDFVIPEQGALLWTDNMMMPQKPPHPYAAETMMNYVYEPEVAAKIAAYVNYVTPVVGAKEVLAKTDPKLADDPLIFPDDADLERLQPYFNLSPEEERQVVEEMTRVTGA